MNIVLALMGALFLLSWRGDFETSDAAVVIRHREGKAMIEEGRLSPDERQQLQDIVRESPIAVGEILIARSGKISFSRRIPTELHQPIRNVLACERSEFSGSRCELRVTFFSAGRLTLGLRTTALGLTGAFRLGTAAVGFRRSTAR